MKGFILSSILAISLVGCGGMSTADTMHLVFNTAHDTYIAYCDTHKGSTGCTSANKAEANKAYNLADTGINDFADGKITQAEAQALINKALELFAKFEGK